MRAKEIVVSPMTPVQANVIRSEPVRCQDKGVEIGHDLAYRRNNPPVCNRRLLLVQVQHSSDVARVGMEMIIVIDVASPADPGRLGRVVKVVDSAFFQQSVRYSGNALLLAGRRSRLLLFFLSRFVPEQRFEMSPRAEHFGLGRSGVSSMEFQAFFRED